MKLIKLFSFSPSLWASELTITQLSCVEVCNLSCITFESSAHLKTSSQEYELVAFREAASEHRAITPSVQVVRVHFIASFVDGLVL
jgi:hypothetical protein